jgi:hypothetical protein
MEPHQNSTRSQIRVKIMRLRSVVASVGDSDLDTQFISDSDTDPEHCCGSGRLGPDPVPDLDPRLLKLKYFYPKYIFVIVMENVCIKF